jgi:pantoate--beta-alanine ligase
MGYLHDGHLSLIRRARAENDLVVMSLFVNPTQFAAGEDLDRYPRDLERDLNLATGAGVDAVLHPEPGEMYDPGHCTWVDVEGLTDHLCGASRPGHFRGVTTVVAKLFSLCRPERAYFGQKDVQQALLIRRMAADLDLGVEVVVCPIVREPDGLAMSSRNVYLAPAERAQAPSMYRALCEAEAAIAAGERDAGVVRATVLGVLAEAPLGRVDYVEIVGADDLRPVDVIVGEVVVAVAVRFGAARLVDNVVATA